MGLDVGRILSGTLNTLASRFLPLLGMWFLYFALSIVAMVVFFLVIGTGSLTGIAALGAADDPTALGALGAGLILTVLLFYLVYLLIYVAQGASLTAKASPLQDLPFGEAFFAGIRCAFTLLVATLILLVVGFVGMLILSAVLALIGLAAGSTVSTIFSLLLLAVMVYFMCRLSLMLPIASVEGQLNPITVIARSWKLTSGNVLSIFLALLLYIVVLLVLVLLLFIPISGLEAAEAPGVGTLLFLFLAISAIGIFASLSQAALVSVIHAELTGTTDPNLEDTFT